MSLETWRAKISGDVAVKLAVCLIVGILLPFALFGYWNLRLQRQHSEQIVLDWAHRISDLMKHGTRYQMLRNDRQALYDFIRTVGGEPGVRRVRVYNEIFLPVIGLLVLVSIWLLLQRTRLGMIIRAGVQDREMVEALGINVRQVFTMVFALGVGLAALGGALGAPSTGLSNGMGESLFLNALIALAIGGLTNYPGAALGSVLVGLLQQFMVKYGQIGIPIPFTQVVFKPTPPLVPASTVLLMVIILLILPNGLLGKKE